ncbi:MAG: hypothetical protein KDK51_00745 [Deltaproteobacteria bacterium]|nr:hypothetical protein [Deltaproteobacteria bacterium]
MKVGSLVAETAGMSGGAKWKAFVPSGYSENVVCVQVDIIRRKEDYNLVTFQFFINTDTDLVDFHHISVDKKVLSLLKFEEVRSKMLLTDLKK